MKFRFLVLDEFDNFYGTNDEAAAKECAIDMIVVDCSLGITIDSKGELESYIDDLDEREDD